MPISRDDMYWLEDSNDPVHHIFDDLREALPANADTEQFDAAFHIAFVSDEVSAQERDWARSLLQDWVAEYDLDFNEIFDWDAWREWYEGA